MLKNYVLIESFDHKLVLLDIKRYISEHKKDNIMKIDLGQNDIVRIYTGDPKDEHSQKFSAFGRHIFDADTETLVIQALLVIINEMYKEKGNEGSKKNQASSK